jgi:spore coat polysaccharide biosynthesis protein SpsF
MATAAFVQARMGSSRLPGKVLESIEGRPSLLRITDRVARVAGLDRLVVLTTSLRRDDPIAALCAEAGIGCIRGAESDVLGRFYLALGETDAERVVRITADCPLIDPEVIEELLALHERSPGLAYASVATGALGSEAGYRRFPDGLDAEVVTASALSEAWRESRDPYEREHVTPFIWRRPQRFPAAVLECEADHGEERWTVDFPEDLEFVRAVYGRLGDDSFGWRQVLELLEREPELRELNCLHRAGRA